MPNKTESISVRTPSTAQYVSGTVNGVKTIWTRTGMDKWTTVTERSDDFLYHLELDITLTSGLTYHTKYDVTYGLRLITDRTEDDVAKGTPKGYYNAEDLNRVGAAMEYLQGRFQSYGFEIHISPKVDWTMDALPRFADMKKYLDEVEILRQQIAVYQTTPETPPDMQFLTWEEANDIEKILQDIDMLLSFMVQAWFYCGDLYSGELR